MKKIYFTFFKAFLGGGLAGVTLGEGYGLFMPFAITLLWSVSRYPWAGFCWGFIAILLSHKWLLALHPISWIGVNPELSLPLIILIWVFCGVFGGALVGLWSLLRNQFNFDRFLSQHRFENKIIYAIFLSSIWGLGEEILSRGPLFWIGIGSSLLPDDRYLAGLARLFGTGGLATIQLMIGWWIWQIIIGFESRKNLKKFVLLGFGYIFIAHFIGFLLLIDSPDIGKQKVALWQTNIPIRKKFSKEEINSLPSKVNRALNSASDMDASFLIAPEGTLPLNQTSIENLPVNFLSGGFRKVRGSQRSSLLVFDSEEETFSTALDKYRLVPLGEWIPGFTSKIFKGGLSAVGGLDSGEPSRLLKWEGPSLAGIICYELSNGSAIANAVRGGAEWILVIANLDPYPISLQKQFLSIAQVRSIETAKDLISVSNTGPTSLIRSDGEINKLFPSNEELIESVELSLNKRKTFYTTFGDAPLILTLCISFISLIRLNKYHLRDIYSAEMSPPPRTKSPQ